MKAATLLVVWCVTRTLIFALPTSSTKSSSDKERSSLDFEDDPIGYLSEEASAFLEEFWNEDTAKVGKDAEVSRNDNKISEVSARNDLSLEDKIENYMRTHDVTFKLPVVGTLKMGARNLDRSELDFNLKMFSDEVEEARKSKLKKILTPILVFVLLKAMVLVPLALGALLLQAFSALQLSSISFFISAGLAVFQLCKKIAENNAHAQVAAHGPWETPVAHAAARSFNAIDGNESGQDLAYSGYDR